MADPMGDRMKGYEMTEAGRKATPLLPVLARLDGKCFSGFTRGLARPYDQRLTDLMVETTTHLVRETSAVCGYTQSDEVTLAWYTDSPHSQLYFDGRIQKMVSVLAATASVYFNFRLRERIPEKSLLSPVFDCRVWTVPTLDEAANVFLWREFDAVKNSVTMAAQEHYSHQALMHKNSAQKQQMLWERGVNWNDYPASFKRGTYVQRRVVTGRFTPEELESLPPRHRARSEPGLEFERSEHRRLSLPPLSRVANRVGVLFRGKEPVSMGEAAGRTPEAAAVSD